ncbi:tRNA modification GTPase [Alkalithermobacter thermoalcaliphilus JW-YL-7 = DSM 7308]|uniref:tRNA modification GTPase MnmE n=1 Tax=Alkalithermobacter thermoalcaliphilus JW-YL-7 = DSM 7308 TaxID=1121328 RepID=A0A150FT40_CLOPD|nr:tRNA modification GTPase mnmE [[Clostridium] paradoxum JW-YL-7 = DSM 7308]SHL08677.1 tRNA modification GTPase [[Clostridium] paradoxum JW-YL-7 = DSM 7308]
MYIEDTIAAIATPAGEGGIGIVRMSGDKSLDILKNIFKSISGKELDDYKPRTLIYGHIQEGEKVIDEVLVAYMKGPYSYTREDIVEINCHGGFLSVKKILELVLKKGARLAEPGEFTKRAFLNGRIDLSQAEAVIDVIRAKTDLSYNIAQGQLGGNLSNEIKSLRNRLTQMLAHIEVTLDFSEEEEIDSITYETLYDSAIKLRQDMKKLYDTSETGKIMRDGLKTAIIGKPNVGKSSLLNAILKESRAIVTDIPGTTRDVIEEFVNIKGIPLKIIDTAGIRETEDIVEKIGVERSKEFLQMADLIIFMLDASRELSKEDIQIMEDIKEKKAIVIINKTDLPQKIDEDIIRKYVQDKRIIKISIKERLGLSDLEDQIVDMVYKGDLVQNNDLMITNVRHKNALEKAISSLEDAIVAIKDKMFLDFISVDIKNAWDYLGEVTGDTVSEELIDVIFRDFCIGK